MEDKSIDELIAASKGGLEVAPEGAEEKLTEKLTEIELQKKEELAKERAESLGLSYINLVGFPIGAETIGLVPEDVARKERLVVFFNSGEEMRVATTNPDNPNLDGIVKGLQRKFPTANLKIYFTSDHSLEEAFILYKTIPKVREIQEGISISEEDINRLQEEIQNFEQLNERVNKTTNMTEIMVMIIASAMKANASDIHIEAAEKEIILRFRLDGMLHTVGSIPKDVWKRLISRIKNVSGLIINVTDVPQDGRITITLKNDKLEIRVSTLPSSYGESVVMRLLKSTAESLKFEDLGIRGQAEEILKKEMTRPNGMILTTGPTGSGKTTTLYSILTQINSPDKKIITLEDPIEYKLSGITQSQIDTDAGYTFAIGLRSILRQDPDIVMVGEIRDQETAVTAANAALTGHLVISTVHTNDAAGALPRLLALGLPAFQLAPAINAIIGQRLVRKLCDSCKEARPLDPALLERVKKVIADLPDEAKTKIDMNNLTFYEGKGCDACSNIGFKGRVGIYEVLGMNRDIEQLVLTGTVSEYAMRDIEKKNKVITMVGDGILKALDGITSVEEVFRVIE